MHGTDEITSTETTRIDAEPDGVTDQEAGGVERLRERTRLRHVPSVATRLPT